MNRVGYLVVGCWLAGGWFPAAARGEDIVLGMSAAFTGPSRGLGIELYRGSAAYFERLNRRGGVGGRRVVIKAYDDGYNPEPAVANTIRLIEADGVKLLYGYVGTPTVARTLPLLKKYADRGVELAFPFTGAEPHRQPPYAEFVFNLRASYTQETEGLVDAFVGLGRTRVGVFYQLDAYGRGGWHGVRSALRRRDLRMAGEATYQRGATFATDMTAQVNILRGAGPDAVVCVGAYAGCAAFVRDCRDAGWDVPVANVSFVGSEKLLALLAEHGAATGRDYTAGLINSQVVPSYHDTSLPAVREYRDLMAEFRPEPPPGFKDDAYQSPPLSFTSLEGYLDAKLCGIILERAGGDPGRFRQAAEDLGSVDLGIGRPVAFGPARHQGTDAVYFTTVTDGRIVPLTDWKRWSK